MTKAGPFYFTLYEPDNFLSVSIPTYYDFEMKMYQERVVKCFSNNYSPQQW